jgi:copper chaperone CopZ
LTVRSLVKAELADRVGEAPSWFCPAPGCEVVYFSNADAGQRFVRADLRLRVGQKETEPPIPVCYCFDWTVGDVEAELRHTGTSTVPERIRQKIQQGFCRCETMNPQGTCCLGNVHQAVKEVRTRLAATATAAAAGSPRPGSARLATLGAVCTGVVGSACCWLPLLLIAFGFSAAGVGSFFEQYRPSFLSATFALLAVAWYLTYAPAPRRLWTRPRGGDACRASKAVPAAPEDCCSTHRAPAAEQAGGGWFALREINRVMLWAATLVILLFALFPNWSGLIFGDDASAGPDGQEQVVLHIEGMTCAGCAAPLRLALRQVPGVTRVEVNYGRSEAVVTTGPGSAVPSDALLRAVEEAGFRATVERR